MKWQKLFVIVFFCFVSRLCWAQPLPESSKLSEALENEADYLENISSELKLSAEQVKNLEIILEKAKVSLNDWERLSKEQQEAYLALSNDYAALQKKLNYWKLGAILIGLGSLTAGLVTGLVIK
jgi:hypothetical protein